MNNLGQMNGIHIGQFAGSYDGDVVNPDKTSNTEIKCGNYCEKLMKVSSEAICCCLSRGFDRPIGHYSLNINFSEKIYLNADKIYHIFEILDRASRKHSYEADCSKIITVFYNILHGDFTINNSHEVSFVFDILHIVQDEEEFPLYKKALIDLVEEFMKEISAYANQLLDN